MTPVTHDFVTRSLQEEEDARVAKTTPSTVPVEDDGDYEEDEDYEDEEDEDDE